MTAPLPLKDRVERLFRDGYGIDDAVALEPKALQAWMRPVIKGHWREFHQVSRGEAA